MYILHQVYFYNVSYIFRAETFEFTVLNAADILFIELYRLFTRVDKSWIEDVPDTFEFDIILNRFAKIYSRFDT